MTYDTFGFAAALSAAAETGLLTSLLGGPRTSADHARACSLDPRATERVLSVLVTFGVAVRTGDTYAATPAFGDELRNSPGGPDRTIAMWRNVPAFLRTGAPIINTDGAREATYANVVAALGRMFAPAAEQLAAKLPRAPQRVLDIGCGSGVWSLAIAQRFPEARITGLDLPAVLESFTARAEDLGLDDRISTLPGDVHSIAIPREFDLVVIANVLRIESEAKARAIVHRAASALVPGGELLVVDALGGGTPERDRAREVYALHLAMRTAHGRVYSAAEISAWTREAGLESVTALDLDGALGALIAR